MADVIHMLEWRMRQRTDAEAPCRLHTYRENPAGMVPVGSAANRVIRMLRKEMQRKRR